jgi:hypothetical protein
MAYKKPEVLAKSATNRSYVAGCPAKDRGAAGCKNCDRAQ